MLESQLEDVRRLREDAELRGWPSEVQRHGRVVFALESHLARFRRSRTGRSLDTTDIGRVTERLNEELRRRIDVVGIFADRPPLCAGQAVLSLQNDEWAVTKRYMGAESPAKARLRPIGDQSSGPRS